MNLDSSMEVSERSLTRLSSIQNGISLVSLSNQDPCLLHKYDELLANISHLCSVTRCTKIQQFMKCIKRLPSYEYVVVLLDDLDLSTLKNVISRLQQCRYVKVVLIVTSLNRLNGNEDYFTFDMRTDDSINKTIETFGEHHSMFVRLQQLLSVAKDQFDVNNVFITLNRKQKALRDLRQELGPFLWTHTFRCEFGCVCLMIIFSNIFY